MDNGLITENYVEEDNKPSSISSTLKSSQDHQLPSLQDSFLDNLITQNIPVFIYLRSGIKLQGYLEAYDNYIILLKNNITQIVYKHTICSIMPVDNFTNIISSVDNKTINAAVSS